MNEFEIHFINEIKRLHIRKLDVLECLEIKRLHYIANAKFQDKRTGEVHR